MNASKPRGSQILAKQRTAIKTALVVAAALMTMMLPNYAWATWPPGKLTNTATTKPLYCNGAIWGEIVYYTNWTYTDSAGVAHKFSGTSSYSEGSAALCPNTGYTGFTQTMADGTGSITLTTSGGSGSITISANIFPKYYILSLLYDPPGNTSTTGITNTDFYGVTNSISNTFTTGTTFTYSYGVSVFGIGGSQSESVSFSQAYGQTYAFTDQITNGASLTINSTHNPVEHGNDTFWIWLNPQVTVTQTGASAATYSVAPPSGQPVIAVRATVAELQTPTTAGFLSVLEPQVINGVTYPGLSNICANPLPAAQCTQANACGCVASDFTQILDQDPIRSITGTTSPSTIDAKRYFLLSPPPSPFPFLEYGSSVGFSLSDLNQTATTQTETTTYSTTYSTSEGVSETAKPVDFTLQFTQADTFSWSQSVSLSKFSGSTHEMDLTLGTSTVGCAEDVDVYEDYSYHTFVTAPASNVTACDSN